MDPITQKIISLTKTPDGESISSVFDTYCWLGNGDDGAGIHTSQSTVDMTKGGMVMGKRFDTSSDWYVTDTVTSPLDGSQGTPGYGNAVWKGHPSDTGGAEQDWTVPAGVTSVCILCIGGGAGADGGNSGGGGGLTWINDVPVTPGTTLKVLQGKTGGRNGSGNPGGADQHGQKSYVKDANGNIIIQANPGRKDENNSGGSGGNDSSNIGANYLSLTYGGGKGGDGNGGSSGKGGGGGAGGYQGNGGNGGIDCGSGQPAVTGSGGGGGGGGHCTTDGGQGGGVGIYGKGTDGTGGAPGSYASPGSGGSGGGTGAGMYGQWTEETGAFGGGCGAGSGGAGRGAVRILWGAGRAFPDTNVGQDASYTHAEYGSFNNQDKFHVNQEKGIKEWKDTGWTWEKTEPASQLNASTHTGNLAYNFRKAKQFFTIVEYTGNGSTQEIAHDLECKPSMMWIKNRDDDSTYWQVYHAQLDATNPAGYHLRFTEDDRTTSSTIWNNTEPTNSHFSVGFSDSTGVNSSGKKYIAYLFAADQAAFGDSTVDVIAKTGTYDGDSGGPTNITLGWEPQMVMIKCITNGTPRNWIIMDKMRLMSMNRGGGSGIDGFQYINLPGQQDDTNSFIDFTPEGFTLIGSSNNNNVTGQTYIYYAVRNNVRTEPKSATEVFAMDVGSGNYPSFDSGFAVDSAWVKKTTGSNDWNVGFRKSGAYDMKWNDENTNEGVYSNFKWFNSTAWNWGAYGSDYQSWMFKRALGFYDVQYWDGNSTDRMIKHQLGVTPQMAIVKSRSSRTDGWILYHKDIPAQSWLKVHADSGYNSGANMWTAQAPTDTQFPIGDNGAVNYSGTEYIGQFYASIDGISKVGSYEVNANGDSVAVDCGFSAGPRMLLVKRYEVNGAGGGTGADWMLFDTVRGMAEPHATLGEMMDDLPGQKTWTVPAGVTSVSVLCIGGGGGCVLYPAGTTGGSGGGGAALAYKNNISVTPGQTITYNVGDGGKGATNQSNGEPDDVISGNYAENGGFSWFNGTSQNDAVCSAQGGGGAQNYTGGTGGEFSNSTGDGGGSGGTGGSNDGSSSYWAFGGGAAGYSGDGGNGGRWQAGGSYTPGASAGQGGGAGGAAGWANQCGTGAFGEGASGAIGQGGSGGFPQSAGQAGYYPNGGKYGGGGSTHGSGAASRAMRGAQGVVRVVWSTDGTTREFPSTNVQNTDQGYDPVLKLNNQDQSLSGTNYFSKTNSGFTVNANTALTTPNSKYIFLAIA